MSKVYIVFQNCGSLLSLRKKKSYNFCHTNCRKGCRKVYISLEECPILGIFLLLATIERELIVKGCERSTRVRLQYLKLLESSERDACSKFFSVSIKLKKISLKHGSETA
jgi:hypothetical protein